MEDYTLTPYDILGLSENARLGDIQAAYRNLVRLVHPDKRISTWMSKKESEAAFQQIRAAYKTLLKQKKFKEEDAPHDEINYEISNELLCSSSTVKFDINDFNKRFKEVYGKLHCQDPENKGYSSFNHSRDRSNQLDGPQFLPFKETEMVIYEDPEPTTGSITTSCQELGLLEIEDFGIGITTDLGVAFSKDSFVSTKEYKKWEKKCNALPDITLAVEKRLAERDKPIPALSETDKEKLENKNRIQKKVELIRQQQVKKLDNYRKVPLRITFA